MVDTLHNLDNRLRELSTKRKKANQAAHRHRANQRRLLHDAFVLYVLTDCKFDAPLALMDQFNLVSHDEVRAHMEEQYLQKPVAELAQYRCVNNRIEPKVRRTTEKFFKEWKLRMWVQEINDKSATTASFSSIADELSVDSAVQETTGAGSMPTHAGTKKWIQRWRRKWKVSIGRVRTQLGGDITKLSTKVGNTISTIRLKTGKVLGSVSVPVFRAPF